MASSRAGSQVIKFAVHPHLIGIGIHLDIRQQAVVNHVALAEPAALADRHRAARESQLLGDARVECRARDEGQGAFAERAPEGAEHRPIDDRFGSWNGSVRIAHRGPRDHAALEHQFRLDPEESGFPNHQIGEACRPQPSRSHARCRARSRD